MKQEALIREDEKPLAFSHGEMSLTSYPRPGCAFDRSSYTPTSPDCVPGSAAIWQYAEACPPGINPPHGLYDMDLANDTGYATMWSG